MTPEEVELLRELTIVMPTCNRPLELARAIEYWRGTPVTVHILDGSLEPSFHEGRLLLTQSIYYHHIPTVPPTNPQHNVMYRLVISTSLPRTKYSAVCSDDDFYTISSLVESIKYLENNTNIDAVVGSIFTYLKNNKRLLWYFKYRGKKNRLLETNSISQKVNLPSTWFLYAVCKTTIWRQFITTSYEKKKFTETQFYAHEWIMLILSKAMFRTKYLTMITQVRQDTIEGANVGPETAWDDWLLNPANDHLIDEVIEQLIKGFCFVSTPADYEKNSQLARSLIAQEYNRISTNKKNVQSLNQLIRRIVSRSLFKVMPKLKVFSDRPRKLDDCWENLDSMGLGYERSELKYIDELLLKPIEELSVSTKNG